jgi:hypothetical protein
MTERRLDLRTALAIAFLGAVLVVGWLLYNNQRAAEQQQLNGIDLSTSCLIAGGTLTTQAGNQVCVDASGRVLALPS